MIHNIYTAAYQYSSQIYKSDSPTRPIAKLHQTHDIKIGKENWAAI